MSHKHAEELSEKKTADAQSAEPMPRAFLEKFNAEFLAKLSAEETGEGDPVLITMERVQANKAIVFSFSNLTPKTKYTIFLPIKG